MSTRLGQVMPSPDSVDLVRQPGRTLPRSFFASSKEPFKMGLCFRRDNTRPGLGASPPAQIVLLFASYLLLADSSCPHRTEYRIPLHSIAFIESGRLLFERWFALITTDATYRFPYSIRDEGCVDTFLYALRSRLMPIRASSRLVEGMSCGADLELKFACAQSDELDPEERMLIRFFSPHIRTTQAHHWFFRRKLYLPADYVGITNRRILWLTDRHNGQANVGGIIARYCAVARTTHVSVDCMESNWELRIGFAAASPWRISVPTEALHSLSNFVEVVRAQTRACNQSQGHYNIAARIA
jgi:hypothetical protein